LAFLPKPRINFTKAASNSPSSAICRGFALRPAANTIEVIAIDLLTNQTITRGADFTLMPALPKSNVM